MKPLSQSVYAGIPNRSHCLLPSPHKSVEELRMERGRRRQRDPKDYAVFQTPTPPPPPDPLGIQRRGKAEAYSLRRLDRVLADTIRTASRRQIVRPGILTSFVTFPSVSRAREGTSPIGEGRNNKAECDRRMRNTGIIRALEESPIGEPRRRRQLASRCWMVFRRMANRSLGSSISHVLKRHGLRRHTSSFRRANSCEQFNSATI